MNVAVIDIKGIFKYIVRIIIVIFLVIILISFLSKLKNNIKITDKFLTGCLSQESAIFSYKSDNLNFEAYDFTKILAIELSILDKTKITIKNNQTDFAELQNDVVENEKNEIVQSEEPRQIDIEISKAAKTEKVQERNLSGSFSDAYNAVKIKNKSDYTLTEEMMTPDVELTNKKDILIFHTHTCESYTPSELFSYEMTGNYRTTDNNFNVVRVGEELKKYLDGKGFNVEHDTTYHDYPSYSGSYSRSLQTVQNLLYGKTTEIVIDLHRDAVGNGDTYGPTVIVNGQRVAQLMFVIGTDGGGLEHQNWLQNFKIAVKIQEKAEEMYPGLFRPIILTNSRYNQHTAKGASIIEVGATANTLEECLLSMQCLANVLDEVCK